MKFLKYYFLLFILIFFIACNGTKEIKKEETNSSIENIKVKTEAESKIEIKEKNVFEKKLNLYLEAMQSFNIDLIINMTYPKLFTVIDQELFRQYMSSMLNSKDVKMTAFTTNTPQIAPIRRFSNGTEFTQIDYNSTITLQFINPNLYGSREQMNYLYDVSIHKFGVKNVSIDLNKRTLKVTKPEKLLAIKEEGAQWKFLGNDARYRKYFPNFMPIEILQNLE